MKSEKRSPSRGLLERLAQGPVICAEGYRFELERRGYLQAGAFFPEVVLDHREAVEQLHREFVRAGTFSFLGEALGKTPPASRYSPDMSKHYALGTDRRLRSHNVEFAKKLVDGRNGFMLTCT
jgi:S-methylmethionine-dependent homocysteine/selenocysteine methylase